MLRMCVVLESWAFQVLNLLGGVISLLRFAFVLTRCWLLMSGRSVSMDLEWLTLTPLNLTTFSFICPFFVA